MKLQTKGGRSCSRWPNVIVQTWQSEDSIQCVFVSTGSPSRGGHIAVHVFDVNQPSLPTPLYYVLVSISVYDPFNCISFHKFSRQLSAFSLFFRFFRSFVLPVLYPPYWWSFHLFMKVSFSPDLILCGWLGLKHQLTNERTKRVFTFSPSFIWQCRKHPQEQEYFKGTSSPVKRCLHDSQFSDIFASSQMRRSHDTVLK